jgi:long-chain acyl-CoA synthetase
VTTSPAQLFLGQADTRPDDEAIRTSDSWSYGRLATLSAAVAGYLVESGLQPGDRVATILPNSPEYVAIYFGVQIAGGAIVPLNALDKGRTVVRQAEHCGARFLFADSTRADVRAEKSSTPGFTRIDVPRHALRVDAAGDGTWRDLSGDSSASWRRFGAGPKPDALAAILYTSGTTGRPKGVMLSHANLAANMQSILDVLPIRSSDRCLVVLPFCHSFGNSVLTTHLSQGASLVLQNNIAFSKQVLDSGSRPYMAFR